MTRSPIAADTSPTASETPSGEQTGAGGAEGRAAEGTAPEGSGSAVTSGKVVGRVPVGGAEGVDTAGGGVSPIVRAGPGAPPPAPVTEVLPHPAARAAAASSTPARTSGGIRRTAVGDNGDGDSGGGDDSSGVMAPIMARRSGRHGPAGHRVTA